MPRVAAYQVDPLFVDRWSPRSFTGEPVPDAVLLSIFEAARWAPSASNAQPWRFLLSRHDDAAWANLAHQALLLGWHTHGIGGFDRAAARERLAIPDAFAIEAMVALGRAGGLDRLHTDFHAQEAPNDRRPLVETVFAGRFGAPAFAAARTAA